MVAVHPVERVVEPLPKICSLHNCRRLPGCKNLRCKGRYKFVTLPRCKNNQTAAAVQATQPGGEASEDELQIWVKERLRSTKMPGVIAFRDELPYSPTGKLLRRVLRDELSDAGN